MSKHTKGPWHVNSRDDTVRSKDSIRIADIDVINGEWGDNCPESQANARLIAAAPELLQACKAALVTMADDDLYERCRETFKTVESAIAKAEGKEEI